jgi:hypothetical protein
MLDLNFIGLTKTTQDPDLEEFPLCQYTSLTRGEFVATLKAATFYMGGSLEAVLNNIEPIQVEVSKIWQGMYVTGLLEDWIDTCKELGQHPLEALFFHLVLGRFYKDTWILKYSLVGFHKLKKYLTQASVEINEWAGGIHRQNRNFSGRDLAFKKRILTSKLFHRGYGHYHRPLLDNSRSLIKRLDRLAQEICSEADKILMEEYHVVAKEIWVFQGKKVVTFEDVYGYDYDHPISTPEKFVAEKVTAKKKIQAFMSEINGRALKALTSIDDFLTHSLDGFRYGTNAGESLKGFHFDLGLNL